MTKIKKEEPVDINTSIALMLAYLCIKDVEGPLANQVEILDRFNLTNKQQSQICGVKPQSIINAKQKVKK